MKEGVQVRAIITLIRWTMPHNSGPRSFIRNFRDLNASSQLFILSTLLNNVGFLIYCLGHLAKKIPISLLCLF